MDWLSESNVKGSTSLILLGAVDELNIEKLSNEYPMGILWICQKSNDSKTRPNVNLIDIDSNLNDITNIISNFISLNYEFIPSVKVSKKISNEASCNYSQILDTVISLINSTLRARKTRSETGFIRQNQIFSNLPRYLSKRVPNEWSDIGDGCLAIVVGAGPSLDKTLPLLKNGIPKPIVIAADSSLLALRNANIEPDFVISIDPEKTFESCSISGYSPGIAILSTQSHSSWANQWGEKSCYLSGRVVTEDWLSEKGISKTKLLALNNAGLTALAFANFLNPSAILVVGLDLAGGNLGEQRYAENTGRSHIQTISGHYHEVPGNYKPTVPTPFLSDWEETANFCADISGKKMVINLNDRGAKLSGTNLIHPDQIDDLKTALEENIMPFIKSFDIILKERKSIKGMGLIQMLTIITELCDGCWKELDKIKSLDSKSATSVLINIFSNKDFASLMGDFAFATIPKLTSKEEFSSSEIKNISNQLQSLLWRLEDAIIKCEPNEEFLIRFLTEKFS